MATWTRLRAHWERVGPRARDLGFMLVALLASVAQTLALRHDGTVGWSLTLLVGLIGAVALWWRRQHPVIVTLVGIAVFAAIALPVTVAVGLFSLAVDRRDRVLAVMTMVAAAAFSISAAYNTSAGVLEVIVVGLVEAGFCIAAGAYVGARRDLVVALRERAERAEDEQGLRVEQAALAERARIAREMHDVLAHKVSLIAMHAGALEVNATAGPRQVQQTAGLIRTTAHEAMEDLRDVLGVLRAEAQGNGPELAGSDLAPQPRRADIERVVEASRAAGVRADLTMDVGDLPDALARTTYRVVQEGLTNVHKHARGAATTVTIRGDERAGLTVEVVNQRPVGSATLLPGSGTGLLGLRQRITVVGGTLACGPSGDGGWRLAVWLPWVHSPVGTGAGDPR